MFKNLLLISFSLLLVGCASNKESMLKGQARAYKDFKTSNNSSSMYRIAESMKKAQNCETAINLYEQVLQRDPTLIPAYIGLSQCLRYTNRTEAALQALKSIPPQQHTKEYYKELASVMTALQKPNECIEAYKKAYKKDAKDLGTLNGIAVCYDLQGQHEQAHQWYQNAMQISPAHNYLKSNYGLSLALSGKVKEGMEYLKAVVNSKDATPRDRQNLAIVYGLAGNMDKSAKLFAEDLDEDSVRTNLAFVHKMRQTQRLVQKQRKKQIQETKLEEPEEKPAPNPEKPKEKKS